MATVPGSNGIKEFTTGPLAQIARYPTNTDGLDYWHGGEVNYLLIEVNDVGAEAYFEAIVVDQQNRALHRTRLEKLEN